MKIYPISDLHTYDHDVTTDIQVPSDTDVIVIAGDIAHGSTRGMRFMRKFCLLHSDKEIIVVLGNHDYWEMPDKFKVEQEWKDLAEIYSNLHVLIRGDSFIYDGVAFIGGTLWTDLQLEGYDPEFTQNLCIRDWPDFTGRIFKAPGSRFTAEDSVEEFKQTLSNIFNQVSDFKAAGYKTVVITHHLPDRMSLDERFAGNEYNPFYASSEILDFMDDKPDVWIHGHTHARKDYIKDGVRIICNPRGYTTERAFLKEQLHVDFTIEV